MSDTQVCSDCSGTGYVAIAMNVDGKLLTVAGDCSTCNTTGKVPKDD